jgi:hypothetical protein
MLAAAAAPPLALVLGGSALLPKGAREWGSPLRSLPRARRWLDWLDSFWSPVAVVARARSLGTAGITVAVADIGCAIVPCWDGDSVFIVWGSWRL